MYNYKYGDIYTLVIFLSSSVFSSSFITIYKFFCGKVLELL